MHNGLSYSTIRLYLCALRHRQLMDGGRDPSLSSYHRLHYMLRGCHRSLPSSVRPPRLPITTDILATLYQCWSQTPLDYDKTCLWAACCLGFFAFLRSGEFTCRSWSSYNTSMLSLSDVMIDSRTVPTAIHLTLRHSKTDVFGAGVTIHLGKTGSFLCPVAAMLSYLAIRPPMPGPLFLLRSGNPLSREILVTAIRQALANTNIDVSRYNGHSFRIGAATAAAQAGLSDSTIKLLGRWKSAAFTRYLRLPVSSLVAISSRLLHQSSNITLN